MNCIITIKRYYFIKAIIFSTHKAFHVSKEKTLMQVKSPNAWQIQQQCALDVNISCHFRPLE
jgi:hypothetical protein